MKQTEKSKVKLLSEIEQINLTLLKQCHESGCECINHPVHCCPQIGSSMSGTYGYSVYLSSKVLIKMIPLAKHGGVFHWPQTLLQLRLMALTIIGGKGLQLESYRLMERLFYRLLEWANLYADDNVASELATIKRTFRVVL